MIFLKKNCYYELMNVNIFDVFQFIIVIILLDTQFVLSWPLGGFLCWVQSPAGVTLVVFDSISWYNEMLSALLVHLLPQTWNQPFLQGLLFTFSWKWYI